jgi:hypothetical protein
MYRKRVVKAKKQLPLNQSSRSLYIQILLQVNYALNKNSTEKKFNFILRDLTGRIVEMRENNLTDQQLEFGTNLLNGIYVAEIILGDERKWIRIIKQD